MPEPTDQPALLDAAMGSGPSRWARASGVTIFVATAITLVAVSEAVQLWAIENGWLRSVPLGNAQIYFSAAISAVLGSILIAILHAQTKHWERNEARLLSLAGDVRASEQRYLGALQSGLDAFYLLEPVYDNEDEVVDFTFRDVNPAGLVMLSTTRELLIGQRLCELIPINRTQGFFELYRQVLRTGQSLRGDYSVSGWSYEPTWLHIQAVRAGGSVALGVRDITQARAEAERQRESEERLRLLLEAVHDHAIYMLDTEGRVTTWNDGAERLTGYKAEEVIGRHVSLFHPPEESTARSAEGMIREALSMGRVELEAYRLRKDGTRFMADIILSTIRDADGQLRGFAKVVRDITERHRSQRKVEAFTADLLRAKELLETQALELAQKNDELTRAQRAAEAASRAKSDFLANVSHEIRTPMTAILGFAELMDDPAQSPDERAQGVATIRRAGEHLLTIINDILDLSKIEAGRVELERVPIHTLGMLDDCVALFQRRAHERGLSLTFAFDGPLPERFTSDPVRVRQVLVNLIGNAVKFTSSGSVRVVARLLEATPTRPQPALEISVRDTGIGMDEATLARLFRPFTQADNSTTRRFGGTGLGLTIARSLSRMLGGDLVASSSPGQGSTFTFTCDAGGLEGVPLIHAHPGADASAHTPARPGLDGARRTRTAQSLRGVRILLAEDGEDNQRLLRVLLELSGASMTIVDNGQAAVERLLDEASAPRTPAPFDVVLMDMQMPVLDGYGATRRLRDAGYTGPIIALTAHAMSSDRERCMAAGCSDFLTKPVDRLRLVETCERWVARIPSLSGEATRSSDTPPTNKAA